VFTALRTISPSVPTRTAVRKLRVNEIEQSSALLAIFFLFMGVGAALEHGFSKEVTGCRVGGLCCGRLVGAL
jgi:hypothetical protein